MSYQDKDIYFFTWSYHRAQPAERKRKIYEKRSQPMEAKTGLGPSAKMECKGRVLPVIFITWDNLCGFMLLMIAPYQLYFIKK